MISVRLDSFTLYPHIFHYFDYKLLSNKISFFSLITNCQTGSATFPVV